MRSKLYRISSQLSDETGDRKALNLVMYSALGLVSLFMTLLNIFTDKGLLTLCTAIFTVLCILNIVLTVISNSLISIAKYLFAAEVLVMFSFFLVTGNPEGFSAIWICLLPAVGMIFFDRIRGTVICAVMFLILIFFLWTDYGNSFLMYNYTESFKMRFPVLFLASHLLAFLLETSRQIAYKEVRRMEDYYKNLSSIDPLTGTFNRQGMYSTLEKESAYSSAYKIGVAMFDIDFFKSVNDTYGHNAGDIVLSRFAKLLQKNLDGLICRWGGEEFVVVYNNDNVTFEILEQFRRQVEKDVYSVDNNRFGITVSIGMCEKYNFDIKDIDQLINTADSALYQAKNSGRNKTIMLEM